MYQRHVNVYRGIDNKLQFQVKNADQRPVNVVNYTPMFVAFDENERQVLSIEGTLLDDGSSATRGLFEILIPENSLLNLSQQYLSYNVYMIDSSSSKILTYANSHFEATGTIFLSSGAFPGPAANHVVTVFSKNGSLDEWYSESITAEPELNGNGGLHTVAIYTDGFIGDITIQGTLDNQIQDNTVWADISTVTLNDEDEPYPVNITGIFSFIRFKTEVDPLSNITQILVRT